MQELEFHLALPHELTTEKVIALLQAGYKIMDPPGVVYFSRPKPEPQALEEDEIEQQASKALPVRRRQRE